MAKRRNTASNLSTEGKSKVGLKYKLPEFLVQAVSQRTYERWLRRKAAAHLKRDRCRGNNTATGEQYRLAMHRAVAQNRGHDAYTGEDLDWALISEYDNDQSRSHGRSYKHEFALLPTVDHVGDGTGAPDFKICAWRTNGAKHDLGLDEFLSLCRRVLEHHGYTISRTG